VPSYNFYKSSGTGIPACSVIYLQKNEDFTFLSIPNYWYNDHRLKRVLLMMRMNIDIKTSSRARAKNAPQSSFKIAITGRLGLVTIYLQTDYLLQERRSVMGAGGRKK
jgi:hypothetical protein